MTTLTARSSPELAGTTWLRHIAVYGVGSAIAIVLVVWLTQRVDAKLEKIDTVQTDTKALVTEHIAATRDVLIDIRSELKTANCLSRAGRNEAAKALCEARR